MSYPKPKPISKKSFEKTLTQVFRKLPKESAPKPKKTSLFIKSCYEAR